METSLAHRIIAALVEAGVKTVCIAPGSRSSELSLAAAREKRLTKCVHFDERALAFYAYGYAKSSQSAVAIITTSGSAVANLFPAVMESFHERVPLILLTADRPSELKEVMANQTCDQLKLFGTYVKQFTHIPAHHPRLSSHWVTSTLAHAVHTAVQSPAGPVHLNCEFREPFFQEPLPSYTPSLPYYEEREITLSSYNLEKWTNKLSSYQQGVIIAGKMPAHVSSEALVLLAQKLRWPILADPLSNLRSEVNADSPVIAYYHDLLTQPDTFKPDCILHVGDQLVSKVLEKWLKAHSPSTYLVVADHDLRYDPYGLITHRIQMTPDRFCEAVIPLLTPASSSSWMDEWKAASHPIETVINSEISSLSEMGLIRYLHHHLPSHFSLYCSNSMPIRDVDRLFFPSHPVGTLFGQRGVSGIDGNLAVAIGVKEGRGRPLVAVVGDLAFLYDLNSLALLKSSVHPLIVIVINNQGGGIFSFLPIQEQTDVFETYVATAHSYTFSHAAKLFDIPYVKLTDFTQLQEALDQEKTVILELSSCREDNFQEHQALSHQIQQTLLTSLSQRNL
ncbi:MAG: 2-succinyl-5-enolpyruvyl-6-hydroxy-3-cyclohexene-1-carboxylic-acid synthase [Candidatus Rhabdochlamydia sp.]